MQISIISLFDKSFFASLFENGIIKSAIEKGIININYINIRDFSNYKHKKVDDSPFGGGPGMLLMPSPTIEAIRSVKKKDDYTVYLSPQGNLLNSSICKRLSKENHLILLCGHYEGVDERVIQKEVHEEISIGDYVLTNGGIAAIALIDSTIRFIPKVIGNSDSVKEDSFENYLFKGPQYTKPDSFENMKVPDVLKGGNHKEIMEWRFNEGLKKTERVRPDLYQKYIKKELKNVKC